MTLTVLDLFPLNALHAECEDEMDRAIRQAYYEGVRTGRAEILEALDSQVQNLRRKYQN